MSDFGLNIVLEAPAVDAEITRLEKFDERYRVHTKEAMSKTVLLVESGGKQYAPVWMGHLRRSLSSKVEVQVGSTIIGRVGSNLDSPYPSVQESGRMPGKKMPPPSALERWVYLVLGVPEAEAHGVAFVVARAIGRRGLKGKFFLTRAYAEAKERIFGFFLDAADKILKDMKDLRS